MLCEYGCGQEATHQFKNGKWCCSKHWSKCLNMKKIGKNNSLYKKKLSTEHIKKISESKKGRVGSFLNKKHTLKTIQKLKKINIGRIVDKKTRKKISKNSKRTIKQIKEKYPTFSKIEEMRYNPNKPGEKEIQVHCKNHNCINSKEKGGWFTPSKYQIPERIRAIEKNKSYGSSNIYCSKQCKQECPLFNLRSDPFKVVKELYTPSEYQTWRITVLEREDYKCEYCEEKATHVHHSRPQKLEPGFVLDPDFGVACCEKCHYKYGHKTGTECNTGNLANIICV